MHVVWADARWYQILNGIKFWVLASGPPGGFWGRVAVETMLESGDVKIMLGISRLTTCFPEII